MAATAMGPTVTLPRYLIVASILDVNRATQSSRVGATGMGSELGLCPKRRLRSQEAAKSSGGLKLNSDARIWADWATIKS